MLYDFKEGVSRLSVIISLGIRNVTREGLEPPGPRARMR